MAFSHLINCFLLTFGPYIILYKAKNLSEYGALRVCLFAALACLLTAASKMIIIASLFSGGFESNDFDLASEINKNIFNMIDYVGIYIALKYRWTFVDNPTIRILAFTIGWSLFESVCGNLFYFILNATGDEFSWKYIVRGISSNLDIIDTFCLVCMIAFMSKSFKKNKSLFNPINLIIFMIIFAKSVLLPMYQNYLAQQHHLAENYFELLAPKGAFSFMILAITLVGKLNQNQLSIDIKNLCCL